MNYIFFILITSSIILGILNGKSEHVTSAMLDGCNLAVKISFSLIGIMAFWLGVMRIAEKSGLVKFLTKLIAPLISPLFKDIPKDSEAFGNISMSLSANALGLTNAATPIGIKVMQDLQNNNQQKEVANDSMCMFLAMNTAGFQIIPATVIAVLVGVGATNPTEIILPTLIVTSLSFCSAIFFAIIYRKIWNRKVENQKGRADA